MKPISIAAAVLVGTASALAILVNSRADRPAAPMAPPAPLAVAPVLRRAAAMPTPLSVPSSQGASVPQVTPPPEPTNVGADLVPAPSPTPAAPCQVACSPSTGLVGELVLILNETKSVDTFALTCSLLGKMGAEARPAVPAMIRNAERLGLLRKALLTGQRGKRQDAADALAELMEHIVAPASESARQGACLGAAAGAMAGSLTGTAPIGPPQDCTKPAATTPEVHSSSPTSIPPSPPGPSF
jgi:hypothetical protein